MRNAISWAVSYLLILSLVNDFHSKWQTVTSWNGFITDVIVGLTITVGGAGIFVACWSFWDSGKEGKQLPKNKKRESANE